MQVQLSTLDVPDNEVLTNFERVLAVRSEISTQTWNWRLGDNDTSSISGQHPRNDAALALLLKRSGSLLTYLEANFNAPQGGGNLQFVRQPDGTAQVTMTLNDQFARQDARRKTEMVLGFREGFNQYERPNVLKAFSPIVNDAYDQMRQATVRLMDLNTKITRDNDEYRHKLESDYDTARVNLEAEHKSRMQSLEAEYARKADELKKRENLLEERKKALDDRDNTHARRQKQEDLIKKLQEYQKSFQLTRDTARKRLPLHAAFISGLALMAILAGANLWYALQPLQPGVPFWWLPMRALGYTAGFVFLLIYYIRWQDGWAQAHADEEFSLKRLELDGIRAGWLVEVLLEWQREGKGDMPPELVQRLGANLFAQPATRPGATHPTEDILASLLGSSSSIQLDLRNQKASIERKGQERAKAAGA